MAINYQYNNTPAPERIVLEPGDYPFTVTDWARKVSKSDNEMIELTLEFDDGGKCYENLVFVDKAHWKIDQFLRCILINSPPKEGQQISFDDDLLAGARGMASVIKTTFTGRDSKPKDRNEVSEYLEIPAPKAPAADPF